MAVKKRNKLPIPEINFEHLFFEFFIGPSNF